MNISEVYLQTILEKAVRNAFQKPFPCSQLNIENILKDKKTENHFFMFSLLILKFLNGLKGPRLLSIIYNVPIVKYI